MSRSNDFLKKEIEGLKSEIASLKEELSNKEKLCKNIKNRYDTLIENSLANITVIDKEGNYLEVNKNAAKALGSTADKIIGKNMHDFLKKEDADVYLSRNKGFIENDETKTYEREFDLDSGKKTFLILDQVITDDSGNGVALQSLSIDVTEIAELKDQLSETKNKLESVFKNAPVGILIYDSQCNILDCNKHLLSTLEQPKEKIVGTNILNSLKSIELLTAVQDSITYGKSHYNGILDIGYNLKEIPVKINFKIIYDEDGRMLFGLAIIEDVSKEKETEKKLIEAKEKAEESDRLKSAFLRNISHEVRTPMNGILGFSALLTEEGANENQKLYINVIRKSTTQLLRIVEDIITISKIETGQEEIKNTGFSPCKLLNEIYSEYFDIIHKDESKDIKFGIEKIVNADVQIFSDFSKIRRIVGILLDNAFKFTSSGEIQFGCLKVKNDIVFFVKDTGVGIPADKQKIILKSFTQANKEIVQEYGGTGLGLPIAVGLLKLMKGKLSINSELGKGTEVRFSIPVFNCPDTNKSKINVSGQEDIRILVAEDEFLNFLYIKELLKDTGAEVVHASNGRSALELYSKSKFDLVLIDLKMPILNGFEVIKEIRKRNKDIPVIAQTAYSYKYEECIAAGFSDYISKPFNKNQIMDKIDQFCRLRS